MSFASQRAALQAAIARDGLGPAEELILGSTVPCFRILPDGEADRAPLGATRLGGAPDLPEGVAWPRDEDGRLANFFGQLDFADLTGRIDAPDLPREGLLSLFTTIFESAAKPVMVKTLVAPHGARLTRAQAPPDKQAAPSVSQNQARIGCPRSPQKINQRPAARTMSSCSAIATGWAALASPIRERMVCHGLGAKLVVSAAAAAARRACPYEIAASGNLLFHASLNKSFPSTSGQSCRKAPRKLVSSIPSYRPP
jgi:hypothetical protein